MGENVNEIFVTMIQVAEENIEIKKRLIKILSLDSDRRQLALKILIENIRHKDAPDKFASAVSYFMDDCVADRALELLKSTD
ncbi:MAG: hypothetical protein KJ645_07595 [Planctomycetes bacterium]|nr:hypothetical protein [Planctomycetota bacterium]